MLLVHEPFFPFIQPQKYYLRNIQRGIVLRDDILLGLLKRVFADNRLDIFKGTTSEFRAGFYEGLEFIEKQEGC